MSDIITDDLTRQQIIDRLVADDVRLMMKCARDNDFDFVAHRFEHGFQGYAIMTNEDLIAEWHEVKENYEFFWEERPYDVA
tara:strand:- start:3560 stop:3802 length:243 start_codon:yes stop_codon:yes gene_type:complete